jgi:ArsR family transcriptional regulator, virulence genes transcriptional regulator
MLYLQSILIKQFRNIEVWELVALAKGRNKQIFGFHARICRTLGHAKRLEIISLLREGELSVSELARQMEVSLPNASQHLAILRDKGVVTARREGVTVYYRVTDPRIIQACDLMRAVLFDQLAHSGKLVETAEET